MLLDQLELLFIPILFILGFLLIKRNKRKGISLLLLLSLLLHKEVFSIYRWDILPVRVFMLSISFYVVTEAINYIKKRKSKHRLYEDIYDLVHDPFVISLSILLLVNAVSIVFTRNLTASISLLGFFVTVVFLGFFLYFELNDKPDLALKYIKLYIKLVFIACLFGVFQLYLFLVHGITIGALWSIPGHTPRVGSVFWDVNHFGALLAGLMPVLGIFILIELPWKTKAFHALVFVVMLVFLLLTNSRTAWMIAFFSFITFITVMLLQRYRLKGIFGLVLALIILSLPLLNEYSDKSSPFRAKVKNYFHYRIDSFDSHILLLEGTVQIFEKLPILGGGYGGFFEHFSRTEVASTYFGRDPAALNTRVPAHTIWGEQLSETGVLGISVFLILMFVLLGTIFYAAFHLENKKDKLLTAAMGSTLVGWLIAGVFYSYKSEFFWIIFFLYFIYAVGALKNKFVFENIAAFYFRSSVWPPVFLSILGFIVIFWNLGTHHLIPWDEAIYSKIAKNMVMQHEYLTMKWWPDLIWYEKPPLYMWFAAVFMKILGISELSARLPSAVFGLGTVLLTYKFGKDLYNKTVGLLAAFVLLTTFQFLYYSRVAMLDVTLTFFVTLSLYFYWHGEEEIKRKYWILSGIFAGLGVMTKGVVGFLPYLVIITHQLTLLLSKKKKFDTQLIVNLALSALFSALVFLPWHLYMYKNFGLPFLENYIGYHVIRRAAEGIEDKGRPFFWYIVVLKVSMRIWFIALLAAFPVTLLTVFTPLRKFVIRYTPFRVYSYMKDLFLVVYALTVFIFFSIAQSKLVWYILPLYPVLALIVGLFIERVIRSVYPKSLLKKALLIYMVILVGLLYLFLNKEMVYTYDLTGKEATLIKQKDALFGIEPVLYADRIELPLLLYYSDGPFEVVDFGPLKEKLSNTTYDESIIFITKESRFRQFKEDHPEIDQEDRKDEWILGHKPSQKELDEEELREYEREKEDLERTITNAQEKGESVPLVTFNRLRVLENQIINLRLKIEASTQ